jgi:hypothetical protein
MIAYASRTGCRRNLDTLRRFGWRILVPPEKPTVPEGFLYAIDNGAWHAHQAGEPFPALRFSKLIERHGENADFIVLPDMVCAGRRSLEFSLRWRECLKHIGRPFLLPVQNDPLTGDNMTPADVRPYLGSELGIFVGGDTAWKLGTLHEWAELAQATGCHLHVGRVNTRRRIRKCAMAGVDSFDGSSASRYSVNAMKLDAERRQLAFRMA